jgi:hypothetical protein
MKKPAQKAWSELGWQIVGAVVGAVFLLGIGSWAAWLTIDEIQQGKKLQGVERVGPCRTAGITNGECQRQARLIFAACYVQREECREKYGMELVRAPQRDRRGGEALQPGSTGSQQPGPRGGGDVSGDVGAGRGGGDQGPATDRGGSGQPSAPPAPGAQPDPAPSPPPANPGNGNGQPPVAPGTGGPPSSPPGKGPVEDVTSTAAGVVEQAGKDVEGAVGKATCNPVVSLCSK